MTLLLGEFDAAFVAILLVLFGYAVARIERAWHERAEVRRRWRRDAALESRADLQERMADILHGEARAWTAKAARTAQAQEREREGAAS